MAILEGFFGIAQASPLSTAFALLVLTFLIRTIHRIFFHPISHIPGPLVAKITSLWLHYHAYIGDEASILHSLHQTYGPLLRVAPNHVDIGDADAIPPIYITGEGFPKADCYENFDIDGHQTIFSALDPDYRNPRAKAVVPMFSTASIRNSTPLLYGCVDRMVTRMQHEAATGKPVNILNLTRSLAVDAVTTHLFQLNYSGTEEKSSRLSVSGFVDAFVAVGRFFYMSNFTFSWLEWAVETFSPDEHTQSSIEVVEKFVDNLVNQTMEGSLNYPGRLMDLGLERSEIKSQCKDLIFAGTDSTGMNLATICRYLALNPQRLQRLSKELSDNKSSTPSAEIQALPYLTAVMKECLRLSMANPTRLPHKVPDPGWTFKSTFFPPGTILGCSAFELHLDPIAFPDPEVFVPERWLNDDPKVREGMNKNWFAFGAGSRACIARNLAMTELYLGTERLVESGVLEGARVCQEKVEIYEWFNSSVKGDKIELIWPEGVKMI